MKDVTVAKEQSASFQVELTKGDARARWFKNDKEIEFSEHVMLKIDGKRQKLIIYNATFEDAGAYTCVVGNKKRTAKLKVEAPTVEFTAKLPDKMTVPQDTDVNFTVQLSRPDVPVQWLKNGQPVPEKEKDKFQFIKEKNVYKMIVRRAQKDDAAEYSCAAGNVKTTTKLQVQEAHAEFTLKLRDVIVRESDTATLLVEVTRETFEVRWMKDGQTLKPTDRVVMEKEGCRRRLIIKETMLEDRGMYTCVLDEKICSSTLTVESTPRVVSEKRHFKVKRGGNVVVDVEFMALPQPKIEWLCKGKTVSPDKKRTVENYGNKTVLTIKKVEDPDVGNYTLKLSNKCGECKTDFTVSIIDKPKPPGMPNASEIGDTNLTLSWKVPDSDGGSPVTNYLIEYHDRNTLRWSTYNEKFTIDQPFTKVEKLKEGEEYMFRVIAVNEVGKSDPSPGTKYILVREPKAGEPPAIVEHLKPVTCGMKKPATMSCRISGQPPPTIKWLKNGKDLLVLKNITTTYENQIATMKIAETTEKSAGRYTCKATNHLGSVETSSELKIQEPPTIQYDESMKNVRLKSFSEYILDIKVFGYPSPELVWFKNGKVLESTKHTLVQVREDSTTITIRSVENTDSATYTLQLTNSAGTVKYDFRLFVLAKPLPPEGPIAFHKIEKNSVTIGWQPPSIGGSEVLSYIIERCEIRRKVWIEVTTVKSDVLTQEITELSEGIEYAFRVIATNEYGRSDPLTSDPVAPKSLFDKPHAPKGPFTTSNMTENSFTLSWLAPDNDGGSPIIEYIVERKEANRKAWQRVATTDGKSLSMEVTGLKKDTAYHFRVCCRNDIGHSPYFAPEETITPGLKISPPSSPVGPLAILNMTNKTITLSWQPPANTGGAELTAYIIEKRESTKKAWNRLETLEPHVTTYTVHNLTHKKEYFFRVFAENPAGLSPPLETDAAIKLTSTAVRPSPPTGPLEVVVTGPSSIVLAWGRPESDGGSPILGYTVAMKNVRRIMWMEVGQVDGETQRLQVKDLQEGSEYMVRIMARNEVGISDPLEPEDPVKVIRPAGVIVEPDRPGGPLVISEVQADSVHLSWKPPSEDGGGNILGYLIEAKDFLHVDIHKTYIWSDGPQTECLVKGLQTSHIYQFRVYAQNEAGRGEALLNKNVIRMKAASKKPSAPSKPLVEIEDDESVLLQWTIPEGLTDVNFIIERYEWKSDLWMQCNHELVIRKSYLVTDLIPGKEYKFRVSCENVYGVGPPSEESELVRLKENEGEPPTIVVPVTDCLVKVDDNACFSCEYAGTQPITVNWSKDGIRVREGLGASITTESTKSTLTLEEIDSDDDECSVQCDLRNSEGKASSKAKIKILCPPKISCPSSYKDGLTYDEGDNLRLKATFTGKPTPEVRWFFNDEEPALDERVEVSHQTDFIEVRICEVKQSDAGSYEFLAQNVMGKDSVAVKVSVTGPPSPPSGLPFLEAVNHEFLLKWTIPLQDGGSSVFNYIVEIRKLESDEWQRFANVRDTYLPITDIEVLEKSVFRIRAVNIYGASEPSEVCHLSKGLSDGVDIAEDRKLPPEIEYLDVQDIGSKVEYSDSTRDIAQSTSQSDLVNLGEIYSEEITAGKINREVSFAESLEMETDNPLKIMYVGTQTLISVPILNYACSDVYDFDDITHFAAEVSPQKEYAIQNIDNILCYTVCWFTTVLESCFRHIPFNQQASVHDFTLNFHDCALQNYLPLCYDFVSGEYIWTTSSLKDEVRFTEDCVGIIDVKESVCVDIFLSKLIGLDCAEVVSHCDYKEAIFMFIHPLVFESLLPFIADSAFKHYLTVNFEMNDSISVYEALLFHRATAFEIKDEIKRAVGMTHLSEQFENLAGLKCVPMTSFKPALSVLPMSRTAVTEPKERNEVLQETDFTVPSENEKFRLNILPRQISLSDFVDKFLNASDICIKCGMTDTCLCSILDDDTSISYATDRNGIEVNKMKLPSTSQNVMQENICSSEITENIPDWLRLVSPFYLSSQETTDENITDLDDLKPQSKDLTIESDVSKSYLKDRSVQELLNLAEEVERSFSQKAEEIESLENILHEEISSLEKDLEAVHEIHKTFWNESLVSWITPDSLNKQDAEAFEGDKIFEKDLIDFKMDVPSVKDGEEKQEEYAPQIITHLQNRVVQCGCRTRLYCSISGNPDPQIAWLKNGKLLSPSSRYVCSNLVEFGLYLDIFNAKSSDSGEYMCIATNCHGSAQSQAYVRVVGHREYSPEEPRFLSSPEDLTAAEGDTITLEWKISGTPFPHVMWFKNTERIETSLRIDTFSNHRGCCRIVLHNVTPKDGAIYTCYLENEAGSSVSTVVVKVSDDQQISSEKRQEVDSTLSNLLTLVEDSNIPSLKYYEKLLNQGNASLYLPTGKKSRKSKKGMRVPGPPFAPRILNSGKTWAILCWSAPTNRIGNTNDVLYLLERRLLEEADWKEVARTQYTLVTVAGLKSGQSYAFRISAGNKNGWGPPVMLTPPVHCAGNTEATTTKYTIM